MSSDDLQWTHIKMCDSIVEPTVSDDYTVHVTSLKPDYVTDMIVTLSITLRMNLRVLS